MEMASEVGPSSSSVHVSNTYAGYGRLIEEYVNFLRSKLAFHREHQEFNGTAKRFV
jgi:ANTH domain